MPDPPGTQSVGVRMHLAAAIFFLDIPKARPLPQIKATFSILMIQSLLEKNMYKINGQCLYTRLILLVQSVFKYIYQTGLK